MINQSPKTDAELAELDVAAMLRHGLADIDGAAGQALFSEGAVAAAIVLDQLDVLPRSVTYLAEVVRHGGLRYALGLPEPLPVPPQAEIAQSWLTAAEEVTDDIDGDRRMARWWDAEPRSSPCDGPPAPAPEAQAVSVHPLRTPLRRR